MSEQYDAIVLGLGGMGSAAAYHLARRGQRVLGLEAFGPGHANGSSHGRTRIIREAYSESPQYMPLIQRAYALWRELEVESGQPLLRVTGGVAIGPADHESIQGVLASGRAWGVPCEVLSPAETERRFPAFRVPDGMVTVFQPNSGILAPEAAGRAHRDLAVRHGADLRFHEPAHGWAADGAGVQVTTGAGAYRAERLIITAGPWSGSVLSDLGIPLTVTRMVNVHFAPTDPERFWPEHCPIFGMRLPIGDYYGMPLLPGQGVKIGRHDAGEVCTPETARRTVSDGDIAALRQVLDQMMPGAAGRVLHTLTCLYTLTPDHHFVIDRHPTYPQIAYACGFSGHGFKFAGVVGEIMADLAIDETSRHPIDFLSARRFSSVA
ncbi:MAG: N-methyl-L-tryptophan oxidase [Chloroflexi bacterium]|nr:N-methyl-L-tryptophan oxidase [Chloroflexota bacterium]